MTSVISANHEGFILQPNLWELQAVLELKRHDIDEKWG
jgi:hypothetical protein